MVAITALTASDEGFALDDALTRRPWPIAVNASGHAVLTPPANYRIVRATSAVTREQHSQRVAALASSVSGRLSGAQLRPFVGAYQIGPDTIAALFPLDLYAGTSPAQTLMRIPQYSISPTSSLVLNRQLSGQTIPTSAGDVRLIVNSDSRYTANALSSASAAENLIGIVADDYDGIVNYPRRNAGDLDTWLDPSGGTLVVQPWISTWLHPADVTTSSRSLRQLRLTTTHIRSEMTTDVGAALPQVIPTRSVQQCDIIADPTLADGTAAFAVILDGSEAVILRGENLRAEATAAQELGRVRLPSQRDTYGRIDNLYLAVNADYVWILLVNRRLVDQRPTVVYQRMMRSNGQFLSSWIDLLPTGTVVWQSGDFVPRQFALTRIPHGDEFAIAITRAVSADVNNETYLITDRATGPRQPVIVRPATDRSIHDVADPLVVAWSYSDPAGFAQSAFRLRRRIGNVDNYYAPDSGTYTSVRNYLQWRQYDTATNPGTLLGAVRQTAAPDRIGSGEDTRDDTDNGTPTKANVLVVRAIRCRVKTGQTVSNIRYRSANTGVNRVVWNAVFPVADSDTAPDVSVAAQGAAEETMETTSRWTSSNRPLSTARNAGDEFYVVAAAWIDTDVAGVSVDIQVSFDNGTTWYGDLSTADDTRVEFLQHEWLDEHVRSEHWSATATAETRVASTEQQVELEEDWATAGSAEWRVAVTVWNSENDQSAESPVRTLRPGGASPPTISAPADNAVQQVLRITVTWTVTTQSRYAVWLIDQNGDAVTSRAAIDSETARTAEVTAPRVGTYSLVLRTWSSTEYPSTVTQAITINHSAGLTVPTCAVTAPANETYVQITGGNFHADANSWRIYRRVRGDASSEILLFGARALNVRTATYRDYSVASGVDYEYRVEVYDTAGPRTQTSVWTR